MNPGSPNHKAHVLICYGILAGSLCSFTFSFSTYSVNFDSVPAAGDIEMNEYHLALKKCFTEDVIFELDLKK